MTEGTFPFRKMEDLVPNLRGDRWTSSARLLAGGPGSSHNYFARLESIISTERPVVVYDQVGCGHSSHPPANELGIGVFIDELTNLRERLHLDRMHLLGTSWGGMLAIEYALLQPHGLVSLVLSSTLASMRSWADEARRLRDEMPERFAVS